MRTEPRGASGAHAWCSPRLPRRRRLGSADSALWASSRGYSERNKSPAEPPRSRAEERRFPNFNEAQSFWGGCVSAAPPPRPRSARCRAGRRVSVWRASRQSSVPPRARNRGRGALGTASCSRPWNTRSQAAGPRSGTPEEDPLREGAHTRAHPTRPAWPVTCSEPGLLFPWQPALLRGLLVLLPEQRQRTGATWPGDTAALTVTARVFVHMEAPRWLESRHSEQAAPQTADPHKASAGQRF